MSTKEPITDPRVQRTIRWIRDAFIALIEEKGFERTTVRDIANRAKLNRATFYLHYLDKHDLLEKTMDSMLGELNEAMKLPPDLSADRFRLQPEDPPPSFVRQFEHIAEHSDFYTVMLGSNGIAGFADRMEQVVQNALIERIMLAQPNDGALALPRELIIRYATSAHIGFIKHWLQRGMPYSPRYMATQLMRLHLLGPTRVTTSAFDT